MQFPNVPFKTHQTALPFYNWALWAVLCIIAAAEIQAASEKVGTSRSGTCPHLHHRLGLSSPTLLQSNARRKRSKIILVDSASTVQQQRQAAAAGRQQPQPRSQQQHQLNSSGQEANGAKPSEQVGSISHILVQVQGSIATAVHEEPPELEAQAARLLAHDADAEGGRRPTIAGRSSWVVFRAWSDMRRKTKQLRQKLLALNGVIIAFLLVGLSLLATMGILYAARQISSLPVEDSCSKDYRPSLLFVQPPSLQRSAASGSQPPPRASTRTPAVKYFTPTDSMEPARLSALPMRSSQRTMVGTVASMASTTTTVAKHPCPAAKVPVLCPGLVVPDSCECMLLLPRLVRECSSGGAMINDLNGVPVLKAMYNFPNTASDSSCLSSPCSPTSERGQSIIEAKPCLILLTLSEDETVFASCREGLSGSLVITDGANRPFGSIRPRAQRVGNDYEIMTATGSQMQVSASGSEEVSITDRDGRVVALTEPVGEEPDRRAVRIGPFTDAGLVALALLAIDLLKDARVEAFNRQFGRLDRKDLLDA